MLPVVWSSKAEKDLTNIIKYVGERNPYAAERLANAIYTSTAPFAEHPYLFRMSQRLEGCRELFVSRNYAVLYRVEIDCVRVMRVVHAMHVHI